MDKIKVINWGIGNMGSGMAKMMLEKEGIEIVGAINMMNVGMDLGEHLGLDKKLGITISDNAEEVLSKTKADVVILCIHSFVEEVVNEIRMICRHGMNVITIAEEMAYPYVTEPELSKQIDECAKANGVTVLGTGVNPGFVLDTLILQLSYACRSVKKIKARRVNDLSPFGYTVMVEQGVGKTVEEFKKGVADGSIYGHVGFEESIPMVADALGLKVVRIEQTKEPIISNVYRETKDVKVQPGMVCGCNHCGYGYDENGEVIITMEHPQQIHPELENVNTGDYIWIEGDPDLNLVIKPETPGGIGTIAAAVNVIPQVLNAEPGLTTMDKIPVAHAIMDDFRNHLKK